MAFVYFFGEWTDDLRCYFLQLPTALVQL